MMTRFLYAAAVAALGAIPAGLGPVPAVVVFAVLVLKLGGRWDSAAAVGAAAADRRGGGCPRNDCALLVATFAARHRGVWMPPAGRQ